jgi:hypothetical protein
MIRNSTWLSATLLSIGALAAIACGHATDDDTGGASADISAAAAASAPLCGDGALATGRLQAGPKGGPDGHTHVSCTAGFSLCKIDPKGPDNDVCGDPNDCFACSAPASSGGGSTGGATGKSIALQYGVRADAQLASKTDKQTFTFVAEKDWKIGFSVIDGPGKPNPPFAVFPSFAAHAVVTIDGKTVTDVTGNIKVSGNALGQVKAPQSGTYTMTVSAADTDGVSPLKFSVTIDPPDFVCKTKTDCQVVIDGKTIDTGLDCQKSLFPDEDGPDKTCVRP